MSEKEVEVLEAMKNAGKPLKYGEIADLTGIETKEVSKIIKSMKKEGKVKSPKRCYYAPSE
ncbi:hypothetical protein BMS3Bbin15_00035 [archaeon BMS3Bbin15]|nr:hypothetical protein BMS3Bbin15_00035 [archaeon BMS3Bbin15]